MAKIKESVKAYRKRIVRRNKPSTLRHRKRLGAKSHMRVKNFWG